MPKVSVIVPVYKAEKYLNRCIDSILTQTFTNWELLLIDDGSPDRSGEICDEYAKKDNRIRVYHKENRGVSSARNCGLNNMCGEFVTFVDADDCLYPNALEVLFKYIATNNYDLIQCCFNRAYISGQRENNVKSVVLNGKDYAISKVLGTHVWGSLFKSEYIRKNKLYFENIKIGEDQIFILDYLKYADSVAKVPDILYYYMDNNESASHNQKIEDIIESVKVFGHRKRDNPIFYKRNDNALLGWFLDIVLSKHVSCNFVSDLYKGVRYAYCNQNLGLKYKLVSFFSNLSISFTFKLIRIFTNLR